MLQNYDLDIQDFLKLTNSGLKVADFVQVKNAIIKRYKMAYGEDIDLSTATADGVFINDLSLIMNNILQTISTIYSNLDVNEATGEYLDILCRLSNITRKQPTKSVASITITNIGDSPVVISRRCEFFDIAGTIWEANEKEDFTLQVDESKSLSVICSEYGQIEAKAGSIINPVDGSLNISVEQTSDATVGQLLESDSQLRERRNQSNGAVGLTVLESLLGAILAFPNIRDCKIYNNPLNSQSSDPTDNTVVGPHSIYVIIRTLGEYDKQAFANLIFSKLTPGISTTRTQSTLDVHREYVPEILGISESSMSTTVYWKEAQPISEQLTISILTLDRFNANEADYSSNLTDAKDDEFLQIGAQMIKYMNNLRIGYTPSSAELMSEVFDADPTFNGRRTYFVNSISQLQTNPETFYHYTKVQVRKTAANSFDIVLS